MAIELEALHRLSADTYRRATELGLLPERGIELIDGLVVRILPKGPGTGTRSTSSTSSSSSRAEPDTRSAATA